MDITFEFSDAELPAEKLELIRKTLKIEEAETVEAINKIAKAATTEYIQMLVEGGMPNRADEAKQDRLFYLILNFFEHQLPNESQISTIFQLTQSQSKTLLKNTVSRFRHKLEQSLNTSMVSVINAAEADDTRYLAVINSEVVRDELNMLITQNEPTFKPITKRKGSASQYEISADSYVLLQQLLGMDE